MGTRTAVAAPDGGGHKVLGRAAGSPNRDCRNGAGYAYLHTALDDHSRIAYTEDLPDETAPTCAGVAGRPRRLPMRGRGQGGRP